MRTASCMLAFFAGIIPATAHTEPEPPIEVKGVRFDDTPEAAKEKFIFLQCHDRARKPGDILAATTLCGAQNNTYAGAKASISMLFDEVGFGEAFIKVAPSDFPQVVAALTEKYGRPTRTRHEAMTTAMNVKVDNVSHHWSLSGARIEAIRYAGRIDESVVSVTSARFDAVREDAKKDAQTNAQRNM
jgi:hypothetical protein